MPETVLVALVAATSAVGGGIIHRAFDVWSARRYGVGPLRDQLVTTLEATVKAEAGRISQLQRDLDAERARSGELEARLARVEGLLEECLRRRE